MRMGDATPQSRMESSPRFGAWLAHHLGCGFVAGDPRGSLARMGITLRVYDCPLRLPGKVVYGVWVPTLRRIELYACNDARADREIVATLGHEVWHAFQSADRTGRSDKVVRRRIGTRDEERQAHRFAEAWLRWLGFEGVRVCARALRTLAVDHPKRSRSIELRFPGLSGCGESGFCILNIAS
jgi:hypothetical protein